MGCLHIRAMRRIAEEVKAFGVALAGEARFGVGFFDFVEDFLGCLTFGGIFRCINKIKITKG